MKSRLSKGSTNGQTHQTSQLKRSSPGQNGANTGIIAVSEGLMAQISSLSEAILRNGAGSSHGYEPRPEPNGIASVSTDSSDTPHEKNANAQPVKEALQRAQTEQNKLHQSMEKARPKIHSTQQHWLATASETLPTAILETQTLFTTIFTMKFQQ